MTAEEMIEARVVNRDKRIYMALLFVLVAVMVLLSLTLRETAEKAQSLQDELNVEQWIARLQVPTEALFYDRECLSRISELRAQLHQARGSETFLPYTAVTLPSGSLGEMPAVVPQKPVPADNPGALFEASFEQFWHTRSWAACEALANQIETRDGMGKWFVEHRSVFDARIRPLVERVLEAYHPWPRRSACRVLLAIGDRNATLRAAVERLIEEPSELNDADRTQLRESVQGVQWE